MTTREKIMADLKEAMKTGNAFKRDTLRLMTAAFKQAEVDTRKELTDQDIIAILKKEAKSRLETIADMEKAGREAGDTQKELALIESYLPTQLDRAAIEAAAREAITEVGAASAKDTGNVMKVLMARLQGQADGKLVSQVVRDLLS
ncbi:MAG: GatB/YqeY domain-containing protein [Anaerolineae bacterium]|nr:GatB/YqeY domain-containing protein [Anaerolineae bacterium]